jgi:putative membrane protein
MEPWAVETEFSRTDLAEDRTLLASERTFASWTRTGIGCIAIGVGFHVLFAKVHPAWVPKAIASLFLILAIVIVWLAARRAAAVMRRLNPHVVVGARRVNLELISSAVSLGALSLGLVIWLLPIG